MKKIFLYIFCILMVITINNNTYANNFEKKLYKEAILTTNKIVEDYKNWKNINSKIEYIFLEYRYNKDKDPAQKLQNLLKPKIIELNIKNILSRNERKTLNLYNNLYYRTVLLIDYQLN